MRKLKLQVLLVPSIYADIKSDELNPKSTRKFLHITDADTPLRTVESELTDRYKKLYPNAEDLSIEKLQDNDLCDLDPDFEVVDVFESGDVLRVIAENNIQRYSYLGETPAKLKGLDLVQSTPLTVVAPTLLDDTKSSRAKTQEYLEHPDPRIPTKLAQTVWSSPSNRDSVNVSTINQGKTLANESNVSLPPPQNLDDKSIPVKKTRQNGQIESKENKRITSGMLNLPPHAQLEKIDISQNISSHNTSTISSSSSSSSLADKNAESSNIHTNSYDKPSVTQPIVSTIEREEDPLASVSMSQTQGGKRYRSKSFNTADTISRDEVIKMFRKGLGTSRDVRKNSDTTHDKRPSLLRNLDIDMVNGGMSSSDSRRRRRIKRSQDIEENDQNINSTGENVNGGLSATPHDSFVNGSSSMITTDPVNPSEVDFGGLTNKLKLFNKKMKSLVKPGVSFTRTPASKSDNDNYSIKESDPLKINLTNGVYIIPQEGYLTTDNELGCTKSLLNKDGEPADGDPNEVESKDHYRNEILNGINSKSNDIVQSNENMKRSSEENRLEHNENKRKLSIVSSSSEVSEDSSDSESDSSAKKRPRLAASQPTSSKRTPRQRSQTPQPSTINIKDGSNEDNANKVSEHDESSSQGSDGYQTPVNEAQDPAKLPSKTSPKKTSFKLSSLQDLILRGLPEVRDSGNSSAKAKENSESKHSSSEESDSSDDSREESSSDSEESSDSDVGSDKADQSSEFLNLKQLKKGKKKSTKKSNAFYGLMRDSQKRS